MRVIAYGIHRFFVLAAITSSSESNKKYAKSPWAVIEQNPTILEWLVQSSRAFHTYGELPAVKETKII
jgi:cytochrome c oxidase subunit 1